MAKLLTGPFGDAVIPQSKAAQDLIAQRQRDAEIMRDEVLGPMYTREIFGPAVARYGGSPDDLMTDPKEIRWGRNIGKHIKEMRSNVLTYGSLQEGVKDQQDTLTLEWIAGEPGDPESEAAREEVQTAWEANDDAVAMMRGMRECYEWGLRIGENVWDVINRGNVRDLIAPVAVIPRPHGWFRFDQRGRPRFTEDYAIRYPSDYPVVPWLKITYARSGDLHQPYGHGTAEDCYPTVFKIDAEMKKLARITERFGFPPMVVTYPQSWPEGGSKYIALRIQVESQWKNFILLSGNVDRVTYQFAGTEGAYTAANATGTSVLAEVAKYEQWLTMFVQGTAYSSSNQSEGSFARDKVASTDRLYKAPSFAAIDEGMLNRCFVRPIMLINRPSLEESKWPRAKFDTSFGEDLAQRLQIYEFATGHGAKIEAVTFAEDFTIRVQNEPGELLTTAASPVSQPPLPFEQQAAQAFGEQRMRVHTGQWGVLDLPLDFPLLIEGSSDPVRASALQKGHVILTDPGRFRRAG